MEILRNLLDNPAALLFVCLFGIPILGMVINSAVQQYYMHRERMAMIQQGMDPDRIGRAPAAEPEEEEV